MIKKLAVVAIMGALLCLGSCTIEDDGPNFHFSPLEITAAQLPDTFRLSQTYRINFTYLRPNNCTFYDYPDVRKPQGANIRNVVAIGIVRTDMDNCEEVMEEDEAGFDFAVIFNEPYTFRFYQGEDEAGEPQYLEVIVPVD
jgi:hypothetical protein